MQTVSALLERVEGGRACVEAVAGDATHALLHRLARVECSRFIGAALRPLSDQPGRAELRMLGVIAAHHAGKLTAVNRDGLLDSALVERLPGRDVASVIKLMRRGRLHATLVRASGVDAQGQPVHGDHHWWRLTGT